MPVVIKRVALVSVSVPVGVITLVGASTVGGHISTAFERLNGTSDAFLGLDWFVFIPASGFLGGYLAGAMTNTGRRPRLWPLVWLLISPGPYVVAVEALAQQTGGPTLVSTIIVDPLVGPALVAASFLGTFVGRLPRTGAGN